MIGDYITNEMKEVFNSVLGVADYNVAADRSSFSYSTVCNIINQRTKVNQNNAIVVVHLSQIAHEKIQNAQRYYIKAEQQLNQEFKPYQKQ